MVTAADTTSCDIGVRGGRIVALGEKLATGRTEIDATGRYLLPGGVDAHCHMDQPMAGGARMADDFESGTHSAACGGATTVIPFAAQQKGENRVDGYQRRAAPQRRLYAL